MAIVTQTLNVDAFGDNGARTFIADFTRQLLGVPTTALSGVTVNLEFRGDFDYSSGGALDEFGLNIEGNFVGWFTGSEYQPTNTSFTIQQGVRQDVIADGDVDVLFDMGGDVKDVTYYHLSEEYILLTFTWDDGTPSYVTGTLGDNRLTGAGGDDTVSGEAGHDVLKGGAGNDALIGGADDDRLYGEADNDRLFGGSGDDFLNGGVGSDALNGGSGNDTLFGGGDNDRLYGGVGDDELKGRHGK